MARTRKTHEQMVTTPQTFYFERALTQTFLISIFEYFDLFLNVELIWKYFENLMTAF